MSAPRGSYLCGQILCYDIPPELDALRVEAQGWSPELYGMVAVPVERNENLTDADRRPHQPEREAPFDVFDALRPVRDGMLPVKDGVCALYFAEPVPADSVPGTRDAALRIGEETVPVHLRVYPACVPEETLTVVNGYSRKNVTVYHHVEEGTAEAERLDTEYLSMLRRSRQNMLYCPKPEAVSLGENRWSFDFSKMESFLSKTGAMGFRRYTFGIGFRESWKKSTILVNGMPSMSFACYCYLAQMLPALTAFLKAHGWLDRLLIGIADEPTEANATEYRALSGLVRKLAPELRQIDAMSFGPVHGAVDVWVPQNGEYDKHRDEIETFRTYGDEIWWYDCCVPRGEGYINRFLDYDLLSTRYHFWANYRYNLTGYLHWAANCWQPGQDPFRQNCPEHHNADSVCRLPAGDTHIMYPGDGEPWMSVRLENLRASAEEYELLRELAKTEKETADRICLSVFRTFRDVEHDPALFRAAREELLEAASRTEEN